MARDVSDFIVDRMIEWGIHRIYGYPGDGIGGFFGALEKAEKDEKPLQLINGLYDAKMDNQPVVAIVGQQARVALGSDFQQENNLETTFADVAEYVKIVTTPVQAQLVIDRAFRIAKATLRPCVVILPNDIQKAEFEEPTAEHFVSQTGVGHASTRISLPLDELQKAAEILNSGKNVAMLVGQGARGVTDEVLEIARENGVGIVTALLGKAAVPADVGSTAALAADLRIAVKGEVRFDARSSMHLAQVIQMALHEGPKGPTGKFPEKKNYNKKVKSKPSMVPLLALAGLTLVAGAAVYFFNKNKDS